MGEGLEIFGFGVFFCCLGGRLFCFVCLFCILLLFMLVFCLIKGIPDSNITFNKNVLTMLLNK